MDAKAKGIQAEGGHRMTAEEKVKVLEALHIIKRECSEHLCNDKCDLFTENGHCCSLQTNYNMPLEWDLPPLPAYNGEPSFKEWNK